MTTRLFKALVATFLCATVSVIPCGCSDGSGRGEASEADADSDAGADSDADTDSDADADGHSDGDCDSACSSASEGTLGSFCDSRDGATYECVPIGVQTWMAENLDFGERVAQENTQDGSDDKYCYADDADNCAVVGGLYQWHQAMALDSSCDESDCATTSPHQGLCPPGWHVPSADEWSALKNSVGGEASALKASDSTAPDGWSWDDEVGYGNGDDTYDFTAIAGGGRFHAGYCSAHTGDTDSYYCWGYHFRTGFWTTEQDGSTACFEDMSDDQTGVTEMCSSDAGGEKAYGYSLRCVQD